eukprot:jgi/Mesvir1/10698/Mv13786-RA.1
MRRERVVAMAVAPPTEPTETRERGLDAWRKNIIIGFLLRKFVDPLILAIKRGSGAQLLALSLAIGFGVGLFPIIGVTAGMVAALALVLKERVHGPTMVLACFAATPLELGLIIPFLRLGETLTGSPSVPLEATALLSLLWDNLSLGLKCVLHAVLGYVVALPFIIWATHAATLPIMRVLCRKFTPTLARE